MPFGEYLPFQDFLESLGIMQLTGVRGGFSVGTGPRLLAVPGAPPASPLICYEIIFPDEVTESAARPGWLLNVTNDAWFGSSAGPYQHFHQAQVRAVEQGLPVVRAANTGISAVIDPYGRILAEIGLGEKGVDRRRPAQSGPADSLRAVRNHSRNLGVTTCALPAGSPVACNHFGRTVKRSIGQMRLRGCKHA